MTLLGIPRGRWWAALAAGSLSILVAISLAACGKGEPASGGGTGSGASQAGFAAVDITGASYASRLELPDAGGTVRQLSDFKGKVVIVFFGFTQCPDVCPSTLGDIAQMRQALGAEGARVQPIFVSLDPQRDTPEILKAYAAAFGEDVVALRGTDEQIKATAKEFKVFYSRVPGKTPDTYTIDHTAGSWVFDPQGRVRLFMRHGQSVEAMKADVSRLLAGS